MAGVLLQALSCQRRPKPVDLASRLPDQRHGKRRLTLHVFDDKWSDLRKLRRIGLVSPDHQPHQIVIEVGIHGLQKRRRFARPSSQCRVNRTASSPSQAPLPSSPCGKPQPPALYSLSPRSERPPCRCRWQSTRRRGRHALPGTRCIRRTSESTGRRDAEC